ncbi:MAG: hypothetical protein J6Y03_00675 [Alphaproteobacteria bacterium]|nr:hypothetical protein [Alphaproteobacteria bacterium]
MTKKVYFLSVAFLLVTFLCAVHCWLGWKTFNWTGDTASIALLNMCGWHPAIISYMLKIAYFFWGVHIYPFLLLQVIPFYLAIFIMVWAVFRRYNTFWALALILPFFTRQFYLLPLELLSSSFSVVWTFLLYSLILYGVLNPDFKSKWVKRTYYTITVIVFCIALVSRQNAIIQVWPAMLVWIGLYLNKKDFKIGAYLGRFIIFSVFSAVFCIALNLGLTALLNHSDKGNIYPATPTFVHQIAGACLPDMDTSCFDETWFDPKWAENSDKWEKLKEVYDNNRLYADSFAASWVKEKPFPHFTKLDGLYQKWAYALIKHPYNFWIHVKDFYSVMWFQKWSGQRILKVKYMPDEEFEISSYHTHPLSDEEKLQRQALAKQMSPEEMRIFWNTPRRKIGKFLEKVLPTPNTILFVMENFVFFIIALILWLRQRKNNLRLFFMSISLAGVLSNILIPLFTPTVWHRYMYSVFSCATISFCVFIILISPSLYKIKKLFN